MSDEIDARSAKALAYTPEAPAVVGAIVSLRHGGEIRVERGLVRPEDAARLDAEGGAERHGAKGAKAKKGLPNKLVLE